MTKVDTLISDDEIKRYYEKNKNNFKASEPLIKLRYINLIKGNTKLGIINNKLLNFSKKDQAELQKMAVQFKNYALNDSIWVDVNQVYEKLPFINQENKQKFISPGMAYQFTDNNLIWLVKIKDVVEKNNNVPLQYIKPTIKQIILNNRKKDLINKIQTEITNDAIKDKDFEIFK
jgi:isochorismate synthase EntC